VIANATQIHQVIMNLCTNASHAMDDQGGILTVDLVDVHLDDCRYVSGQKVVPGDYVKLAVTDTGCGIPSDIMDRIFEPYFTTKSVEEGTGMGLALVQSIINEAGGVVQVKSAVNAGTRFEILLPVTEKEKRAEKKYSESLKPGKGSILFVDDEIPITVLFKKILEGHGYKVTAFNDPLKALTAFENAPDKFDAVISDLTMPDIKGDKLIEKIHAERDDIPCILCTGYSRELTKNTDSIPGLKAILIKPIDRARLLVTLQQVLYDEPVQTD
jgi:CheY-like chemotaxis protein